MRRGILIGAIFCAFLRTTGSMPAQERVVPFPEYKPSVAVSGVVRIVGSSTVSRVAEIWSDGFRRHHPDVRVEIESPGSAKAIAAVAKDPLVIGALSHVPDEDGLKQLAGTIRKVAVCDDAIAFFVHKDNPIRSVTLQQLRALYERPAADVPAPTWGQLGAKDEWRDRPVKLLGRRLTAGTTDAVGDLLFPGKDFRAGIEPCRNESQLLKRISETPEAIGYASWGRGGKEVRPLSVARNDKSAFIEPAAAADGDEYPLARSLWFVVVIPDAGLDPVRREFLTYVLSDEGQEDVLKDGLLSLTLPTLRAGRDRLGLDDGLK